MFLFTGSSLMLESPPGFPSGRMYRLPRVFNKRIARRQNPWLKYRHSCYNLYRFRGPGISRFGVIVFIHLRTHVIDQAICFYYRIVPEKFPAFVDRNTLPYGSASGCRPLCKRRRSYQQTQPNSRGGNLLNSSFEEVIENVFYKKTICHFGVLTAGVSAM